jgi:hypothetical protein
MTRTLALVAIAVCGCSKPNESGAAPAASVATTAAPSACGAGAFKATSGVFCVAAAGFTASPETKNDPNIEVKFTKGATVFTVWYRDDAAGNDYAASEGNVETDSKAAYNKVEDRGKLTGATGAYMLWTQDKRIHQFRVHVKGNKHHLVCEATTYDPKVIEPDVIGACKSLRPTD